MKKSVIALIFGTLFICTGGVALNVNRPLSLETALSSRFDRYIKFNTFSVAGQPMYSPILLSRFYENRSYQPAWVDQNKILPRAQELVAGLQQVYRDGLKRKDYHWELIQNLLMEVRDIESDQNKIPFTLLINLELLFTDAFLTYGSHLLAGRINPTAIDETWIANRRDANLPDVLEEAVTEDNVRGMLEKLYPSQPLYQSLRDALARYNTFEKNEAWPVIEDGPEIGVGDQDPRVIELRKRLHYEGDYRRKLTFSDLFDEPLEWALKKYQERYGLVQDGILSEETTRSLQIPIEDRVNILRANLERCRWLPDNLGPKHIRVNIADYNLDVVEESKPIKSMRVIVGKRYRRTPVFSSTVTHVVSNPYWNVPRRIATLDILPKVKRDPGYLMNQKFQVYGPTGEGMQKIDPSIIDWSTVNKENFKFHFRQDPGPQNALGRFKFLFPNQFDVYLHDTPSRKLFHSHDRSFSSGCVRIEKPVELAEYLLKDKQEEDEQFVENLLKESRERYFSLKEPVPVHIMYWTAWVDHRGWVHFRDDVYDRDPPLLEALNRDLLVYVPQ